MKLSTQSVTDDTNGIFIFSLTEFACEPELSPTSMYLTVPRGKNVSIVCTVTSDPVSDITWFFNGRPIDQGQYHPAVSEFIFKATHATKNGRKCFSIQECVLIPKGGQ